MKVSTWKWFAILVLGIVCDNALAQEMTSPSSPPLNPQIPASGPACITPPPPPYCPAPYLAMPPTGETPPSSTEQPGQTTQPSQDQQQMNPAQASASPQTSAQGAPANSSSGAGFASSMGFPGNTVASAGSGLASAAQGVITSTGVTFSGSLTPAPLILPGLFSAVQTDIVVPVDRVFCYYGYFDRFNVSTATGVQPGFNLNMFTLGAEKTFFNGVCSFMIRAPLLQATANMTGQPIDGLGDITAGLKMVLFGNPETGSAISAGLMVSAPTARNETFTLSTITNNVTGGLPQTTSTTVNPTFIQPWLGGLFNLNRLFIQEYIGAVVPSDGRVATLINENLTLGYQVYRGTPDSLLRFVSPTVGAQLLAPTNHRGVQTLTEPFTNVSVPPTVNSFGFPDQLFVSEGLLVGLGKGSVLSASLIEPVIGPKAFSFGVTAGFTLLF